jgi:hypothetical protein
MCRLRKPRQHWRNRGFPKKQAQKKIGSAEKNRREEKQSAKSYASACFKSSIKSSLSSKPKDTRTVPGLTPARASSSFDML